MSGRALRLASERLFEVFVSLIRPRRATAPARQLDRQPRGRCARLRARRHLAATLCAALLLAAARLSAQSPDAAAIEVIAADQTGAVVPGAHVSIVNTATGSRRESVSGAGGSATIQPLPPGGSYVVTVEKAGFKTETASLAPLRAGETVAVRVLLVAAGERSEITVYGTSAGVRNNSDVAVSLDGERVEQTPILGRKLSALPLLNAAFRPARGTGDLFMNSVFVATGAGGRRQTDYVVDGAMGNESWGRQTMFATIPVSAVAEMQVMSRAVSAEFGWTSGAAVNIVTKSGTNSTHGEALFLGRPGAMQTKTFGTGAQCAPSVSTCVRPAAGGVAVPLVPPDVPDTLAQVSMAAGGPLVPERTHYFISGDYTRQRRTAPVTSPLVPPGTTIDGRYRQLLVDGRIDHVLTQDHKVMLRLNVDRFRDTNPQDAVSGNVLPGAGREFARRAVTAQANETAILGSFAANEIRLQYQNADPVTAFDPITPSTQLTRAGSVPFTSGESRFAHVFSRLGQVSDTFTAVKGNHDLRFGGSVARSTSGGDGTEFGSAFVLGQYTINAASTAPIDQLTLADVTRYQQSFNLGTGSYRLGQWMYTAFAQDSFHPRADITLDAGIRYDRQSFSDGTKNFAPRVGVSWHPLSSASTVVRAAYGVYYTELRANLDASFALNGPQGVFTYTASPGQTGFPSCFTCTPVAFDAGSAAATLPARNVTIRPGMGGFYSQFLDVAKLPGYASATFVNPKSQVGSAGIEKELARGVFVSADYVTQHWTGLDRTVDLNAPSLFARTSPGQVRSAAAADATRPIAPVNGGFRQINVIENLGVADYDALQTMVRVNRGRLAASVSYTLSKATNTTEPDGNGAGPNDYNQLGEEERAPGILDQRHRGVVTASYRLPGDLMVGTVTTLASARPFNATTGTDNNGDGLNNDRPVIDGAVVSRYAFRGTATRDVALFAEAPFHLGGGRTLALRIEAFNAFNHANVFGRNGTYGDAAVPAASFGQATPGLASIEPGRMCQVQARFGF